MERRICRLMVGIFLLLFVAGCQPEIKDKTVHISGLTMGTTWSVVLLPPPDGTDVVTIKLLLQQRLEKINSLMSTYDPESELSRFNNQTSTDWFAISEETAEVVALSLEISRLTGGSFDVSVGPLVELWGFGARKRGETIPTNEEISESLAMVGYENIKLSREPAAVKKLIPRLRIDLSAIAKGYAVDALAELLDQHGIQNYLVEVGGELQISGHRNDGGAWQIAIEKPLEDAREVSTVFPLTNTALATSGNYRNFYLENGQRYAHTLDPVSGKPIRHKLASATVLDPTCARADALATALMVMGEERGRKFCEKNRIAAYFLMHEQESIEVYASPEFQRFVSEVKL